MKLRQSTPALALAGLAALAPAPAAAQQPLPLATYLDMETVSNPQISPDGTRIVYTRGLGRQDQRPPPVVAVTS